MVEVKTLHVPADQTKWKQDLLSQWFLEPRLDAVVDMH